MAITIGDLGGEIRRYLDLLQSKWQGALNVALSEGTGLYKVRVNNRGLDSNNNALTPYSKGYAKSNKKSGLVPKILYRTGTLFSATNLVKTGNVKQIVIQEKQYLSGETTTNVMRYQEEQNKTTIAKMSKSEVEIVKKRIISELKR